MKKWDIIIIASLVVLSFIPTIIFGVFVGNNYNRTYAEITIEGRFYKKIPLSEHSGVDTIDINTKYGSNHVEIIDNTIAITDATCSDSICINQKFISKPGESIVCLPNKVMIEIKGDINDDDVIISH